MEKYFNIHNLATVEISSGNDSLIGNVLCQLSEFEIAKNSECEKADIQIFDYSQKPELKEPNVVSKYYYYKGGMIDIPEELFCADLTAQTIIVYCDHFLLPVNFLIELILLRKKHTFIHAAAISFEGKNYLLPALGGIGKTTALAGFINRGGKLFGDDLVIVSSREMFGYPIAFSVYPYHLGILPIKNGKIISKLKKIKWFNAVDSFLGKSDLLLVRIAKKIIRYCEPPLLNIPPRDLFGRDSLAGRGKPNGIFYLERTDVPGKELSVRGVDAGELSTVCANIMFHEWHHAMSTMYVYCALSGFSMEKIFSDIKSIYGELFAHSGCQTITIPDAIPDDDYQRQLISRITNNGTGGRK